MEQKVKDVSELAKSWGRSFELHYDVDYGIDRKSGWSVVVGGSVAVQFFENPEAALQEAVKRVSEWDSERAKLVKVKDVLEDNPCHHRMSGLDPECVFCEIRSIVF